MLATIYWYKRGSLRNGNYHINTEHRKREKARVGKGHKIKLKVDIETYPSTVCSNGVLGIWVSPPVSPSVISHTPPQTVVNPNAVAKCLAFTEGNALVKVSAVISLVGQYTNFIVPASIMYRIK